MQRHLRLQSGFVEQHLRLQSEFHGTSQFTRVFKLNFEYNSDGNVEFILLFSLSLLYTYVRTITLSILVIKHLVKRAI